jgi:hypothetical protein
MTSPYSALPRHSFWKTGVSEQHPLAVQGLYAKKFAIGADDKIATAGSCFAQHIGRHMKARNAAVLDMEPAPYGLTREQAQQFGYGIYSARYGNIYTARQLVQLAREAFGEFAPANAIWQKAGRYYDALRPSVEPDGLASMAEVIAHRERHVAQVRALLLTADVFIFTLGLTEAWIDKASGTVFPTAPGTIAGRFDPDATEFVNFTAEAVFADLLAFRKLMKQHNPAMRYVVTVSPVPLTATASGQHVLTATTYSKAALRAAAGQFAATCEDADYFPSYELIATPFSRGIFFEANLRSVSPAGVEAAMRMFFAEHDLRGSAPAGPQAATRHDVVCEEQLLEAFA